MTFSTFITHPVVQSALWALAYVLIYIFSKILANKLESGRLKTLITLLPDAMQYAEEKGGTASEKLNIAIDYLQENVKLSRKTISQYIESGITISKTINKKEDTEMISKITETPVTVVQKNLEMTLDENEVISLLNVIAASGRSSDVAQIYSTLKSFTEAKK